MIFASFGRAVIVYVSSSGLGPWARNEPSGWGVRRRAVSSLGPLRASRTDQSARVAFSSASQAATAACASGRSRRGHECRVASSQGPLPRLERPAKAVDLGVGIVGPLGPVDAGEDRLQAVVVLLRDRVELVVVAAGAVDRQAGEAWT